MMKVQRHFDRHARDFDRIYTGDKGPAGRLIDRLFRRDMAWRFRRAVEECGDVRGKSVVDVGCGPGRLALALADRGAKRVTGVDFAPAMIRLAREIAGNDEETDGASGEGRKGGVARGEGGGEDEGGAGRGGRAAAAGRDGGGQAAGEGAVAGWASPSGRTNLEFIGGDFLDMEVAAPYDIAVGLGLFDYLEDARPMLRRMRAAAREKIVASFPRRGTWRAALRKVRLGLQGCPVFYYRESEVRELLREAGFAEVRTETFGQTILAVGKGSR